MLPLLRIHNLTVAFKTGYNTVRPATSDVNLTINKGQIMGIIGESGSGKSVTFLSCLNLLPSHTTISGNLYFFKDTDKPIDLLTCHSYERRKLALKEIAYIFQDPLAALNPSLKIADQIEECILEKLPAIQKKNRVLAALEEVLPGSAERAYNSWPHELSGGQRQRIMIAMAMINKPKLIIADEPTTALDPKVQKSILDLLHSKVKENGSSLVLISHDIQTIAPYCDAISVFKNGTIIESAPTTELLKYPKHAYTKALLYCKPTLNNLGYYLPTVDDYLHTSSPSLSPYPKIKIKEETLIESENISKSYSPSFPILDTIHFYLKEGECVGILGESGSGKSTLAKLLVSLEKPNSGQIKLAPALDQSSIQMIFQDPYASLNPSLSIGSALDEIAAVYHPELNSSERQVFITKLLAETGIQGDVLNKKPRSFSGGQRQRIAIARALAAKPQVLICDEAVSALDISVQAQVLNILKKLQLEKKLSLVFITHDMQIARHICNRIIILKNGKIIEEGPTETIFNSPNETYTKELLSFYKNDVLL